ncbi:putative cdc73/Parafibromin, Paf1 complex subunit Cdc73 domain-containing protein [Helianthus annuus]|nr:putative cdc73/Parafibromin, Paf1 complex subunit Cdc73 domain-containing protein [Helianthus annuus]KAJ0747102.1 putative cdc73/Parafibromin, Paf1 complex subunit Cdc73 domain-containing protein [Helianthus annuus]
MIIQNKLDQIARVNNEYRFNSTLSFPYTIETTYGSKQGNLFTLETLVYFITNLHIKHHDYIRNAGIHRIPAVTLLDRKPFNEYLHGRISNIDTIEFHDYRVNNLPIYPNLNLAPVDDVNLDDLESKVRVRVKAQDKNPIESCTGSFWRMGCLYRRM